MPLLTHKNDTVTTIKIGEADVHILNTSTINEDTFAAELPGSLLTQAKQSFKSVKRQTEWLGVRLLLKYLLGSEVSIGYNASGAPYLINSEQHISISHSGAFVAIVLSKVQIGMDVQIISDKPLRLKSHFLSKEEEHIMGHPLDALTAVKLWCAKEAVYKYLSIPETPLIGGITLCKQAESIVEANHNLCVHFKQYENAIIAVTYKNHANTNK